MCVVFFYCATFISAQFSAVSLYRDCWMETKRIKIAVVGAGAVGLSTAVQLQVAFPDSEVVIIADKFHENTTSHGAAGIFRPTLKKTPGVPIDLLKKWLSDSWDHYHSIAHSENAGRAGVQILSGYHLLDSDEPNILEESMVYSYRKLTNKELEMFPGNQYKNGWFVTTILVEPGRYLAFLTEQFVLKGGSLTEKKLKSFEELVGLHDVVVNCSGLGSLWMLKDRNLIPNRGHVLKVRAPWLKHFVYTEPDGLCYVVPGLELVTVGGTRTDHDMDLSPRQEDSDRIMRDASKVLPSLKNAEVVSEWVGLRPHREPLRVESEVLEYPLGLLKVVHNYGHGAEGISLSWGTSVNAVELVQKIFAP